MLRFCIDERKDTSGGYLALELSSEEDAVSPEFVMESIIDNLLGMSSFLENNKSSYKGIVADFKISLPEGHVSTNYTNVPLILENMEHQKLADFYNLYCGKDCFDNAAEDNGDIWYSFLVFPPSQPVDEQKIWDYYKKNIM